jgi:hypothetical protein
MDNILAVMNKGVRCGNHGRGVKFYHPTAADVRECFAETYHYEAQDEMMIEACRQAEMGYERYLEDRGYWAARAQEDYEARMGIGW